MGNLVSIEAPVPNPVDCGTGSLACSNYNDNNFLLERFFGDPPLEGVSLTLYMQHIYQWCYDSRCNV